MKKIFFTIFFLSAVISFAQNPVITGIPSSYTVIDENIELIFNVTGAKDNGGGSIEGEDLYIWSFSSAGDAKTNGGWTNIKPAAKLLKVSNTEYRLKFPITDGANTYKTLAELYGAEATPGSITSIGYLLRDQAPTFQTGDLTIPFSPFKFIEEEVRTFPSAVTAKDIVTVRFNKNFTGLSNPAMTGAKNISVHIEPSVDALAAVEVATTFIGQYYQASFIPASSFKDLFNGGNLSEIQYYFFDTDNPAIKSATGTIRLRKAGN